MKARAHLDIAGSFAHRAAADQRSEAYYVMLVSCHSHRVLAYARRFAECDDEADDLVSETWAEAWYHRDAFRGSGEYVAWLMRICRTVCLRATKRRRTYYPVEACEAPTVISIGDRLARQELEDARLDLMMALPPRQRLCVISRVIGGMSTRETATFMHCREGTVKATLSSALGSLRRRMPGPSYAAHLE
jgi:RNA polymerase sigma-70 factor, ECF subfamily